MKTALHKTLSPHFSSTKYKASKTTTIAEKEEKLFDVPCVDTWIHSNKTSLYIKWSEHLHANKWKRIFPLICNNVQPYFRIVCVNDFCLCKRCVMLKRFAILSISISLSTSVLSRPLLLLLFHPLTLLPIHFHIIESDERKSFYLSYHTLLSARHFPSFLVFGEHTLTGLHIHAIKTVKRAVSIAKQQHDVSATSDRKKKINFFSLSVFFRLFCWCLNINVVFFQIWIWNI